MTSAMILAWLSLTAATPAAPVEQPVFSCAIGRKRVAVTVKGDELVYRYGTPARTELTIVSSAARGNLFAGAGRYANMEHQLRFVRGRFSYIVFSLGAKPSVEARGVSGVTVMDGTRQVSARTCRRWTELDPSRYDHLRLPEDDDAYLAL